MSEDDLDAIEARADQSKTEVRRWIAHPGDAKRRAEATSEALAIDVLTLAAEVRRLRAALEDVVTTAARFRGQEWPDALARMAARALAGENKEA